MVVYIEKVSTDSSNTQSETLEKVKPVSNEEFLEGLSGFSDISLTARVILGRARMPVGNFLKITRGSIIELAKSKKDTVEVQVNKTTIAEGDVVVNENKISVEIVKIIKRKKFQKLF